MIEIVELSELLHKLDLKHDQFMDFCIYLGCDYNKRPWGFGPDKIGKYIKKHGFGNIENIGLDIN